MTERPQVLGMRMGCWVAWAKHAMRRSARCGLRHRTGPVTSADSQSVKDSYPRGGVQESPVLVCVNPRAGLHVAVIGQ